MKEYNESDVSLVEAYKSEMWLTSPRIKDLRKIALDSLSNTLTVAGCFRFNRNEDEIVFEGGYNAVSFNIFQIMRVFRVEMYFYTYQKDNIDVLETITEELDIECTDFEAIDVFNKMSRQMSYEKRDLRKAKPKFSFKVWLAGLFKKKEKKFNVRIIQ